MDLVVHDGTGTGTRWDWDCDTSGLVHDGTGTGTRWDWDTNGLVHYRTGHICIHTHDLLHPYICQ